MEKEENELDLNTQLEKQPFKNFVPAFDALHQL
jgi:hypothetical protein